MTTATIARKTIKLTIEQKARMLWVAETDEQHVLAVASGSIANTAYAVHHDGREAFYCPCAAYGRCSHMVAANWHLEAKNRAAFVAEFNPCAL